MRRSGRRNRHAPRASPDALIGYARAHIRRGNEVVSPWQEQLASRGTASTRVRASNARRGASFPALRSSPDRRRLPGARRFRLLAANVSADLGRQTTLFRLPMARALAMGLPSAVWGGFQGVRRPPK